MEIWKNIEETGNLYSVSNKGVVKRNKDGKIMKQYLHPNGYMNVKLTYNGKQRNYKAHRLVAKAFLPNPDNLPQVNHKDENRSNNLVENLEWCTSSYNCSYGTRTERIKPQISLPVIQYDLNGKLLNKYPSIIEASRKVGCCDSGISKACRGIYRQYKGYKWRYANL